LALAGVMNILQQKNNGNYLYFANQFVETFKDSDPAAVANLQMEVKKAQSFMIGGEAPDFTLKTPEGQDMSLSELRGKVVLIDFWASWCGPCRRENPNVVRMYNEYKDKGFDILGVSLDKTQDRWVEAIQQDGLSWHHVSDLKGWANEVAQAYGVRSIPHTVLIDAEGKILARNLRGEALEQKLAELFD
nr:TlpA disulfide reductase family protein [Saprospiraceae bacterium]